MILTDERGRPFERPRREDFSSVADFLRAFHAYKDSITNHANESFADAFRAAQRGRR
jgi:hypothetical protein